MKLDIALRLAVPLGGVIMIAVTTAFPMACSDAATPSSQRIAEAENYPHRPIRIIDGLTVGGASDVMARLIGQKLTDRFGQQVIVDNRSGAGGNIGARIAARATPDGYTLFSALSLVLGSSETLYPHRGYDVMKDFAFVTTMASGTYVTAITPSLPAKSVTELVVLAKSRPGQLNYASSGVATAAHLSGELLKSRAGINLLHVPFREGAAPMLAALIADDVQLTFISLPSSLPLIKAGRIRALAVTSEKRAKALPDVPTIAESGFPGYDVTPWYGLLAPAATPGEIVKHLNVEIGNILRLPDIQSRAEPLGLEVTGSTPERFREIMRSEIGKWSKVIKDAGIKSE